MERFRDELEKRVKHNISYDTFVKCMKGTDISPEIIKEIIEERLKFNYSIMIPLAWNLKLKDTPRDVLLNEYIKDMDLSSFSNSWILEPKKEGSVRLATYNIHYWTDVFQSPNVQNILNVIKNIDADILALQEALMPYGTENKSSELSLLGHKDKIQYIPDTFVEDIPYTDRARSIYTTDRWHHKNIIDDIHTMGGFYHIASSVASTTHARDGTLFGNVLLSIKNLPMKSAIGLTLTPYIQGRSATIVFYPKIKVVNSDQNGLIVVSVHLDVFDGTGKTRLSQIRELISYLETDISENIRNVPIIIMGDMNSVKKEDYVQHEIDWLINNNQGFALEFDTIAFMEKSGFKDVFDVQNRCAIKSSTWSARRIDYIFTKGIPDTSILSTYVYYSDASDHIPLVVDIKMENI